MEADENLARTDLTTKQRDKAISIRLRATERLHPTKTKAEAGAKGGRPPKGATPKAAINVMAAKRVRKTKAVQETAKATGLSTSTIERGHGWFRFRSDCLV